MSIESLQSEIESVLAKTGHSWYVGAAAITDFLRWLHEVMVKSGRDQANLLSQVQTVLGSTAMHHLARTLEADNRSVKNYRVLEDCPLNATVVGLCRQRGLDEEDGRHLLAHFLKALDEERFDKDGSTESATVMVYFALGGEAAYHLGGLYVGDAGGMVATQLCGYLDHQLRRFYKLVEMWEMEMAFEKEAAE